MSMPIVLEMERSEEMGWCVRAPVFTQEGLGADPATSLHRPVTSVLWRGGRQSLQAWELV